MIFDRKFVFDQNSENCILRHINKGGCNRIFVYIKYTEKGEENVVFVSEDVATWGDTERFVSEQNIRFAFFENVTNLCWEG